MRRSRTLLAGAALVLASGLGAVAPALGAAQLTTYIGIHAVGAHMGDFCYIDVPHVHPGTPIDLRLYRSLPDRSLLFVGDPVAFGYDGTKFVYAGPHPLAMPELPAQAGVINCYLQGPHYHAFAPTSGQFTFKDGVYWFTGAFGPELDRDKQFAWVNEVRGTPRYHVPQVNPDAAPPGYKAPKLIDYPYPPPPVSLAPVKVPPAPPPPQEKPKGKDGKGKTAGAAAPAKTPGAASKPASGPAASKGAK